MRVAAALASVATSSAAVAHAASSDGSSSSQAGLNGWYPCSEYTFSDEGSSPYDAECAVYTAPLCYSGICEDSTDATVDIFVKRILAPNDSSSYPNVWFFQGGPGASSTAMESGMVELQEYLNYEVNMYTMDHRGTGRSTLLDCVAAQVSTTGSPDGSYIDIDEVGACSADLHKKYGDLSSFSVTSAATDVSTFVSTFTPGETTFIYGVSYGTALVERLIHLDTPEVVGYILDGIATSSGTTLDKFENFSRWDSDFGEVADRFLVQCANDTTCNSKFSTTSLPDTLTQLIDSFDNDPESACATVMVNTTGYGPASYALRDTLGSLFMDASTRTLIPVIAYRLSRCNSDDVTLLTHLLTALNSALSYTSQDDAFESNLLYYLIVYSEMWESPEPTQEEMLQRYLNYSVTSGGTYGSVELYCAFSKEDSTTCNELGVGNYAAESLTYPRDEYFNVAATIPTQASVLLFSSLLDPQTPHKYAEYLYEAINGTEKELVVFQHATHATLWTTPIYDGASLTCSMEILGSYVLAGGDLSNLNKTCVANMPPISFEVDQYMLTNYLSTTDAYEGSYDASLSSPSSSSASESGSSTTSYKTVFIVFTVLFAVALVGCVAFAYRLKSLKRTKPETVMEVVTP